MRCAFKLVTWAMPTPYHRERCIVRHTVNSFGASSKFSLLKIKRRFCTVTNGYQWAEQSYSNL